MQNASESGIFCGLSGETGRVMVNQGRHDDAIEWLEDWKAAPYGLYVNWVLDRAKALQAEGDKP